MLLLDALLLELPLLNRAPAAVNKVSALAIPSKVKEVRVGFLEDIIMAVIILCRVVRRTNIRV